MKRKAHVSRGITVLLAAVALAAFAGTAFADHDRGFRRFKGVGDGFGRERVIVRDHSSGAGPALAGLIGGFILGTAVSQSHPVVVHEHRYYEPDRYCPPDRYYQPEYRYYDPYRDVYYDSLDECGEGYYAPRVIEVIDVRSGQCVRRLRHHDGMWISVGARF